MIFIQKQNACVLSKKISVFRHSQYEDSVSEDVLMVPSTLNGMRIDIEPNILEHLVSGHEVFDIKCVVRPPETIGKTGRYMLVNKHLGCECARDSVSLTEIMVGCNHEEIRLNSTPAKSKARDNSRS